MIVRVVLPDGAVRDVAADEGLSVMEVLRRERLIDGECNGSLSCATCHVWVDAAFVDVLPPPLEGEEEMLDFAFHLAPTSRLSCQIRVGRATDGIVVALPHGNG